MHWEAPRPHQHDVEAHFEAGEPRAGQQKGVRGAPDARPLAPVQGLGRRPQVGARLDLDNGEDGAAPGNDVDLAARVRTRRANTR